MAENKVIIPGPEPDCGNDSSPCSPNCGQVIIHNEGGTINININCCPPQQS